MIGRLWGTREKGQAGRQEPMLETAVSCEAELSLELAPDGRILGCSPVLRRRLRGPVRLDGSQTLDDLVVNPPLWLGESPSHWPRELPVLEFKGAGNACVELNGVVVAQPQGWLLAFVDLSSLRQRQQTLERRLRLLRHAGRLGDRLRGRATEPQAVLADWLEDLALRLQVPWLAVMLWEENECWNLFQRYPAEEADALPSAVELAGITRATSIAALQVQALAPGIWGVPYAEDGTVLAWLCCGFDIQEAAPWLDHDDWLQLFAQLAGPLLKRRRENRLRDWRARYESLEHMSSGGWWEYLPRSRSLRLSAGLARQVLPDVTQDSDIPLRRWLELLVPFDREEFAMKLDVAVARRERFVHAARLRQQEGEGLWYRFEGELVGEGEDERLLGFTLDVDQVRKREEEADAHKARLAGLVDSAPGVIYVQRYEEGALRLMFCSASLQALLGWSVEDLQASPLVSFLHPEDQGLYITRSKQLLKQGRASMQYRIRNRGGEYRWLQDEARLLRDEQGLPVEVIGLFLDVTDAKEAAERVFRSEESYRLLVDDSPAIICRYQPDLKVIFANPTLASALSIERDQVEGLNLGDYLSEEQREEALGRLRGLNPNNPFASSEICIRRSDMKHRWWVMYERGLFDEAGHLLEVQAVGRDNTEVHQTRQQLFQSAKMATLGEMAAGLAHEINQPLSVIQMTLTNLLARVNNATVTSAYLVEKLERIAGQVQRAAGIVNHVCIFGRWSGVEGAMFPLARCIDGALSLVGQKLKLMDIQVDVESVNELPQVKGQPDRLEQVLINLVMNAAYALRERKSRVPDLMPYILIKGKVTPDSVQLLVQDNGGGIPAAIASRIFEPFFTTKPLDQGTGLGLSVSREIINQMSGTLRVENHEDGARFIMELPLHGPAQV
ncbi:MAG TPA: PAS domain-containing protein [Hyphomicrobiales bacterium]|nr:PAS domain-containing protein [Hyphomicrobiales bacterium]